MLCFHCRGHLEEELRQELELQIHGAEKPAIWNLIGIRFVLFPYTMGKLIFWQACWIWRYWIKQLPYAWEDAGYLTQRCLGIPYTTWANMSDIVRDELICKRLWIHKNMEAYRLDVKKEGKRRRS